MNFAYKPLEDYDMKVYEKFQEELKVFIQEQDARKKSNQKELSAFDAPICKRTILSDITPEVLVRIHRNNQKGVAIKVDEFLGMIKSADQYSKGQFLESLLSTWSGCKLKVDRCSNPIPILISNPHINIIGTLQPGVLSEFVTTSRLNNGFIDRCIFVSPLKQEFTSWRIDEPEDTIQNYQKPGDRWGTIVQKLLNMEYDQTGKGVNVLNFTKEARTYLFNWRNDMMNSIPKDVSHARDLGRFTKQADYATRFSLIFQLLRWACGECSNTEVDIVSVKAAISLSEWTELSFLRMMDELTNQKVVPNSQTEKILSELSEEFTTSQALEAGKKARMKERTVNDWLKAQTDFGVIEKVKFGVYRKVVKA